MYSKTLAIAIATSLLCASCAQTKLPWAKEPIGQEVNLAFVVRNNLLFLSSATIDGRSGRFLAGASEPRTTLDTHFASTLPPAAKEERSLQLNEKEQLRFSPIELDLHGVADGIIGADVWGNRAVSIDYVSGLLTYQKEGIHPELMTIYHFAGAPQVTVMVDGKAIDAIVDTASPDTLILPRENSAAHRTHARVKLANADFGDLDIALADVAAPRIGNRILSKFLVTIDYGRHEVGLWRDPRTR
jgi:hypothetical protein